MVKADADANRQEGDRKKEKEVRVSTTVYCICITGNITSLLYGMHTKYVKKRQKQNVKNISNVP